MGKTNNIGTAKIKPLFDRVLLSPETEQQNGTGIIIPRESGDRSHIMCVVAVGESTAISVGDRVIVAKYAGTDVSFGEGQFVLVCEYDILGIIEGDRK